MSDKLKINILWAVTVILCWSALMFVVTKKEVDVDKNVRVQVENEAETKEVSEVR